MLYSTQIRWKNLKEIKLFNTLKFWTVCSPCFEITKFKKLSQFFVAFSEYLNFKTYYQLQAKMKVWFIGPSSEPNIIISTILHPSLCISNGNLNLMNYYQFTRCGKSRWEFRDFEMSNHWLCFDNLIRRERNRRSCYKLKPNFFE